VSAIGVAEVVPALAVGATIAGYWVAVIGREALHERAVLREHSRATRAYYAAVEAAEDDPTFSPETVQRSVLEVVAAADRLWQAGDLAVDGRPDAELVRAWARSRQFWLGSGLQVRGTPSVDLLHIVNREGEDEDRVVARVRVRVHCRHPRLGLIGIRHARLDERWTLGRHHGRWAVLSVEGDPLAGPVLTAPLIPNRSFDTDRLVEASLAELADSQKVRDDKLKELVNANDPPALAMLDLSVIDGRFLPPLIAAVLSHLLQAWETAATGSQAPLEALASPEAATVLLHPGPGLHMVMRDAVLKSWEATHLELARRQPAIAVNLTVEAVRYVSTDDGHERFGNDSDRRNMSLTWTLELTDTPRTPWRLAATDNPATPIPGWS
jgi:hypothetical protein